MWFSVASKYRRNCAERQQARQDVPVARMVQTSEDLRLQSEHLHRIEQQRAMYDRLSVLCTVCNDSSLWSEACLLMFRIRE